VLILLGTIAGLIIIALTAFNPVGTGIGFALSSVAMTVVVLAYLWLDRWEPEPPRLLILAFLWGASVAVIVASILQLVAEAALNPGATESVSPITVVLGAPLTEEAAKGLFLLLMMTGRRRNELNSLTDCLVYAGLVGAGFAWLEDILYIGGGETVGDSLLTAAMRLMSRMLTKISVGTSGTPSVGRPEGNWIPNGGAGGHGMALAANDWQILE